MTILSMLIVIAMQNAPDAGQGAAAAAVVRETAAPASEGAKPVESDAAVKEQSPRNKEQTPANASADSEGGLQDEVQRLQQLQAEIRALLDASPPGPAAPGTAAASSQRANTEPAASEQPSAASQSAAPPSAAPQSAAPPSAAPPAEPLEPLAAADAFYRVGKYSEALSLYNRYPAADKEGASWVLFQKANCLRSLGQANDAIGLYQKLVTEQPDTFLAAEAAWWITAMQWKIDFREN